MQRSFSLQQQTKTVMPQQATSFMNQPPIQKNNAPVIPQKSMKIVVSKVEQQKEDARQQRKEINEEVLELSKLSKKELREYLQDQIDDNSSDDD